MKKLSASTGILQEKLQQLTPLQWLLLILASLLLLGAGFYFFQYKSQSEIIDRLRSDIAGQEKRLATLKKAAAEVEILQKQLEESEEEFTQMLSLLPDQKEIPGLLENVSQVGAEVGLENILFQPQPEQLHEFYAAIPVRLDLIGNFHELGVFFDKVSKLHRILKVENLSLVRQPNGSRLQVGCTIVTYRFIDKPTTDAGPKKK